MMAYTMPQQRKKAESERLRGEREIRSSLLTLTLKDGKLYDSGKEEESKTFHNFHVSLSQLVAFTYLRMAGILYVWVWL